MAITGMSSVRFFGSKNFETKVSIIIMLSITLGFPIASIYFMRTFKELLDDPLINQRYSTLY